MSKESALNMLSNTPAIATVGPDVPAPEATPAPPVSLDSERFAKLAAKEANLLKEREALKAEKAKDEETRKQLLDYKRQIDEFEELKKTDKIAALKRIGFSEEDIFNFLAGKDEPKEPTPVELAQKAAQEEIQKLRDEQKAAAEKAQAERDEKAIKAYKASIGDQIKKDAEKYEYCAHYGPIAEEIIYDTILGYMAEDSELTPHEAMKEAIEAVEQFYEEEDKRMSSLKKRQPRPEPIQETPLKPEVNGRTTLKRPDPTPITATKTETRSEKRERLMRKLAGN